MLSNPGEASLTVKRDSNDYVDSCFAAQIDSTLQQPIEKFSSEDNDPHEPGDADDQYAEYTCNQLVLYDPVANGTVEIEHDPQPIRCQPPSKRHRSSIIPSRVLPSVGAFTVQCANCFKWRLIPTKEKYEEIREHILEQPFYCEAAREWRPDISCDDPADISQDGSRLWAIDKPNIAQPPRGWERLLRIRGEGSTKFADIYYVAPSGKRLRSIVEIQKYLMEHPEYLRDGVTLSQFSFQIPRPLQGDYVKKRPARMAAVCDSGGPLQPSEVRPISWAASVDITDLQLGRPALPLVPSFESPVSDPFYGPANKQARRTPPKQMYNTNPAYNQQQVNAEEPDRLKVL